MQSRRHLVLAGGGHSHLFVLERMARGRMADAQVTLVSPSPQLVYSGMIPGLTAGRYREAELSIDLPALCRAAGAAWVEDAVESVDAAAQRLTLARGGTLAYDLASFDVGSLVAGFDTVPGVAAHAVRVKPIQQAARLRERLEARLPAEGGGRVTIVGGGAAGVEMAFGLARWRRGLAVTVVEAGAEVLDGYAAPARQLVRTLLAERGIAVLTGRAVSGVEASAATFNEGTLLPHDAIVWVAGPAAPPLFRDSGLPVDEQGFVRVWDTLVVERQSALFAAGDCASFVSGAPVPKAGVFAVRQGPRLAANLAAALADELVHPYEPQRHWLSILDTSDGRALAVRGGWMQYGRHCRIWKEWLDRRFVRRFQRLAG